MSVSVVIETWNIGGDAATLAPLIDRLRSQVNSDIDIVVTHANISASERAALDLRLGRAITWVELTRDAGYYEHKNRGFDQSRGEVVAFIDGDCEPSRDWLSALVAPLLAGAHVVAGATSYPGALAPLANSLDFPYFDGASSRRQFSATSRDTAPTVRNFFANNVAFRREVFASRRYPTITPMFHGQCQVLGLQLVEAGIPIVYASEARVTHAWPDGVGEFLHVRLLRGADSTQLLPYVLATYAPAARGPLARLGALPTLALLGVRALTASWSALRHGPALRGLALVAGVTALDALGAAAAPAVYRYVAP